MLFYEDLARHVGGYETLQDAARLFMVPGMGHCGTGTGPNVLGYGGAALPPPPAGYPGQKALRRKTAR